jgi:hypothetical protein
MSAQGASLGRRTVHLPIWPVAALVAAAVAVLGMTLFDDVRPEASVTTVTTQDRLANSSAAIREQGAVGVARPAIDAAVLESSAAAVRERGAALAPTTLGYVPATEIPGAYETKFAPAEGSRVRPRIEKAGPIVVNGEICHQCR